MDAFSTTQLNLYLRMYKLGFPKLRDKPLLITPHGMLIVPSGGLFVQDNRKIHTRYEAIKALLQQKVAVQLLRVENPGLHLIQIV